LYDENTVESYRELGSHIGKVLCRRLDPGRMWARGEPRLLVDELFTVSLAAGLREVPPDADDAPLSSEEWAEDEHQAEEALRKFQDELPLRQALAGLVQRLLAHGDGHAPAREAQRRALRVTAEIVRWAPAWPTRASGLPRGRPAATRSCGPSATATLARSSPSCGRPTATRGDHGPKSA